MNRVIRVLCAEADSERLRPVLDALLKKGLRVSDARNAGKNDIILAALSENFYADHEGTDALLGLIGAGAENVLPLQLDGVPVPDTLKNALYARNIIPAAGREPVQIAERIVSALPRKKRRLPLVLGIAAVILLIAGAVLIIRAGKNGKPAAETEQNAAVLPPELGLTEDDLQKVVDVVIVGD
ncbi:MAG: hypothetical protein IIV93_05615, partial [Clostridia bacterium]|nr:hypothetical protein [Clostridia bacterium]